MAAIRVALVMLLAAALLTGCSAPATLAPESTTSPAPDYGAGLVVPAGYRITVILQAAEPSAERLHDGVERWALTQGVELSTVMASDPDELEQKTTEALGASPDLVVGLGAGVVDVFSLLTAQFLDQQFVVIGAQLPEPTSNVTAVVWEGAAFRGTAISEPDSDQLQAVTSARSLQAIRAGVACVLEGVTGVVLALG